MSSLVQPVHQDPLSTPETAESNIPDNYVSYTLKHTKAKPDITLDNFWTELNCPHVIALGSEPVIGAVGAYYTKLRWETALFAIFYYFVTAFGEFFNSSMECAA